MPAAESIKDHPQVPLTRFHNNTGEFLDLATKTPIALTSHGRERHFVVDSEYFRRLEKIAAGRVAEAMDLRAIRAEDLTGADLALIDASLPTQQELDNDRWNRQTA
jgi:hypothetical protein